MKRSLRLRLFCCLSAAVLAAGCQGGGAQSSLLPGNGSGQGVSLGNVAAGATVVRVHLATPGAPSNGPAPSPTALSGLPLNQNPVAFGTPMPGPASASPGGAAVPAALTLNVLGPTPVTQTIGLASGSPGCVSVSTGQVCQSALALQPGTYLATVTMYASAAASAGSALGVPTTIAFTVASNASNVINLAPAGSVAQLEVVPASSMSAANAQDGIDLFGGGKHPLVAELLDANQNVIVGPNVPSFTIAQAGGTAVLTVAPPTAPALNVFTVSASNAMPGNSSMLRITASFSGAASGMCAQSSSACAATVPLDVRQLLAVANSSANTVTLYVPGQILPVATIQSGVTSPQALVFDAAGDLFVANQLGSVAEYAPPYASAPATIAVGVNHPQALALDGRGNLFVANGSGSNTVTEYAPPYSGAPIASVSAGIGDPVSLGLDTSGDLFVANQAANTVTQYAPPYGGTPTTLSGNLNGPNSLAIDGRGNLFVSNLNSTPSSVVQFSPPFSNASVPSVTITSGVNEQGAIGINPAADLFVPNQGSNSVTEYAPPYGASPTTIVGGQSQPVALAVDTAGNLYVANYGNNTVTVYSQPYAGVSWLTLSYGINGPQALALSPPTSGVLP